ncbi:hypothetical protein [Bacillus coahuilensis]|uniref:hypothetical protein n=1 Tax=Bacillus coahuilensis TaxID=408580 RepID=UPI0001850D0B|nr:hypothetical protein [Bacillus coahuilensis]
MFDPTAFDNLKVVLEGAIYEEDLLGRIQVVNRQDLIDLASLNRTYRIEVLYASIRLTITLSSSLELLSNEILEVNGPTGIYLTIQYHSPNHMAHIVEERIVHNWSTRKFTKKICIENQNTEVTWSYSFKEIIEEHMSDELINIFHFSLEVVKIR